MQFKTHPVATNIYIFKQLQLDMHKHTLISNHRILNPRSPCLLRTQTLSPVCINAPLSVRVYLAKCFLKRKFIIHGVSVWGKGDSWEFSY